MSSFHIQIVLFISVMILLVIIYPIIGYYGSKKLIKDQTEKLKYYRETIIETLVPAIIIMIFFGFSGLHLHDIGLKNIDLKASSLSNLIIYPVIILYILYLIYNIYSIIVLKLNKDVRVKAASKLPIEIKAFLPITKKEKMTWGFVALNAGITEELIYRGYLFYALAMIFPNLSLLIILILSGFIFGIGHIYQGIEVIKPLLLGLFFGFLYIVFDSLIPVMTIHFIQDLVVRDLLQEESV